MTKSILFNNNLTAFQGRQIQNIFNINNDKIVILINLICMFAI